LDVSIGLSGAGMVRPMYAPHGLGAYAAAAVKRAVRRTPVFTVHRILLPDEAEGIIARGEADAVTLVRALIPDPHWPPGAPPPTGGAAGTTQGCSGTLPQGRPVPCATTREAGREASLGAGPLPPAARRKRVVVVGGGPAGLEAAWVAAARGHDVVLLER